MVSTTSDTAGDRDHGNLIVPATEYSPCLVVRAVPHWSLYQWLRLLADGPVAAIPAEVVPAVDLFRRTIGHRVVGGRGVEPVHGLWERWERAIAPGRSLDEVANDLQVSAAQFAADLVGAMSLAERAFRDGPWTDAQPLIAQAFETLQAHVVPHFAAMATAQARHLDLRWPERVDVHLVITTYDRFEAYAPPVTVDVSRSRGLSLCETVLHEVTHTASGHGLEARVRAALLEMGIGGRPLADACHALIFVASAHQVRASIDASHIDYATGRGLYTRFGVPDLPASWRRFATGEVDERELVQAIVAQMTLHTE